MMVRPINEQQSQIGKIQAGTGEPIITDTYVSCCDHWLPKLLPGTLGKRMFITRQQVFFAERRPGLAARAPRSS